MEALISRFLFCVVTCLWRFRPGARRYNEIGRSWSEMMFKQHQLFDRLLVVMFLGVCDYLLLMIFSRVTLP